MNAVVPGQIDGKPAPVIQEIAVPGPGPHEVLIKVAAAGVNRGDLMQVSGMYPPPAGAPLTLGLEASGTVAAVGAGVTRWRVGGSGLRAGRGRRLRRVLHRA